MSAARTSGARQLSSTDVMIAQLNDEIDEILVSYNEHALNCRTCRNPLDTYLAGRKLCRIGHDLAVKAAELLYKKAGLVSKGSFSITYDRGYGAVESLIKMIALANQGEATHTIVDLKRAIPREQLEKKPKPKSIEPESYRKKVEYVQPSSSRAEKAAAAPAGGRGSAYAEDMRRVHGETHGRIEGLERRQRDHTPERRTHRPREVYDDPRTSRLNVPHSPRQAPDSPSSTATNLSTSTNKSVSFNDVAEVFTFRP